MNFKMFFKFDVVYKTVQIRAYFIFFSKFLEIFLASQLPIRRIIFIQNE